MWSWVLLVKPSNSRLIPSRRRPQAVLASSGRTADAFLLFLPECRVKTATPSVTVATTRYLYRGYRRRKIVMCRNMTGSSLQLLARRKVM
jgi:hypothetical protein